MMKFRGHDFTLGERVVEDIPIEWHRVRAECRKCGEKRKVYWGVAMSDLNLGRCVWWWR